MPNFFAYFVLLAWPCVVLIMFRRMPFERALIWSILGGYLFLPPSLASFNVPLIPAFDKVSIPNLSALAVCTLVLGRRVSFLPDSWIGRLLLVLFVLSPLATVLTNSDPVRFGVYEYPDFSVYYPGAATQPDLPGLRLHDALSAVVNQAIFVLPFFLARQFLATPQALRELLVAMVLAIVIYTLPMLFEVAAGPVLNILIYGFIQHDYWQMVRFGGFRPMVFLPHGLWMAFLAMSGFLAALALMRGAEAQDRPRFLAAALWLGTMLLLCRSLGPYVYAAALAPLVLAASPRLQLRVALLMAVVALSYPLLRGGGLVPVDLMLDWAATVDEERAASLAFRFHHEEALLARAAERPWFGWGGWARNFVYDTITGFTNSISDGRWVIVIGFFGWTGYIVEFGLLALPLLLLALQARRMPRHEISPWLGPLALILGVNMIDLLPNATLIPFTWLLAGAMLGHAELLRRQHQTRARPARVSAASAPAPGRTVL